MKTQAIAAVFTLIAAAAAAPGSGASALVHPGDIFKRHVCGPRDCMSGAHCAELGCEGGCQTTGYCAGMPECNTHFNNCKRTAGYDPRTVEYAIAQKGGKIIKRADGIEERTADADAYVDSVLEAMGAPVAKRQGIIHVGAETDDGSLKKRQGIIHVGADTDEEVQKRQGIIHVGAETDDESLKKRQGIIHVNAADTAGETPGCPECM